MKTFITTEIFTEAEQKILIQPSPGSDGIEIYFSELDGTHKSNSLYICKEELPIIVEKLQEMMNYVTK